MFSIHGLIRSENMQLGFDADTGGQIKYVIELCNALSKMKAVERVDLFTRLISDKKVSDDYSNSEEIVNDKFRINRIQCGGRKYIRKELLWPHLDEFVNKTIKYIKKEKRVPDVVHGHYADGGYVAKELSNIFNIPFVFTGHSLGRIKKEKLLNDGLREQDILKHYKINKRIEAEEAVLEKTDLVVTSTTQEVEKQYELYTNYKNARYKVIPPGIDLTKFFPYYDTALSEQEDSEELKFANSSILRELDHFFQFPEKPLILALCRPEKRKNIEGLIKAYGEDFDLQAIANLAIYAGIRKDIEKKEDNEREVLTQMLLLMDKYNLYGKMAIPKKHDFEFEVPELYRIAAKKGGVFVNAALTEPFGITLLESSATGLPLVSTNDGGPNDIIKNCKSGILIDPSSTSEISEAVKKILVHEDLWNKYSRNGILKTREYYSWDSHVESYLTQIKDITKKPDSTDRISVKGNTRIGKRLTDIEHLLVTDIDNTLLGGEKDDIQYLMKLLKENEGDTGFAVASGRSLDSIKKVLKDNNVISPDIIISSVGSEIHYGSEYYYDKGWESHISKQWKPEKIIEVLKGLDFLEFQPDDAQKKYKISCIMEPVKDYQSIIHNKLNYNGLRYNLIYSHNKYLDILPYRASKGKALKYLSYKWNIALRNIITCGDSGNDEEMLRGDTSAVVVGNYSSELEKLKHSRRIFFSQKKYASGIIDGINHYKIFDKINKKEGFHGNTK